MAPLAEKHNISYSQFACIGSGFSAIGLGATLKRWYGITDVRFFERHSDLGGTWFVNTYPGCACDVPSILYSFSFAPNPNWTRVLPSARELWAYLKKVADDHDLPAKMTFGADVIRCEWLQHSRRWRLHIRSTDDGTVSLHECQFLFTGAGALSKPREPDMPGIDSFRGPVFHAARWRHDVDLRGKRVAVVGNGCTATQVVPSILDKTEHLTQYIRSKHWIIPPVDVPHTKTIQWLFGHVPGFMAFVRFIVFCIAEDELRSFYMTNAGARFRVRREAQIASYMRKTAPQKYHKLLVPEFEIGCKRRIFDPGYLAALHEPNITLTDDPIVEVLPDAVRTKSGIMTETDVIVLANGYATNQFLPGIQVVGRDGVTLDQHWSSFDGPEAYNCCALNEFPNFFMILGPNTATGHTSTIMAIENAINYSLRVIKPVIDGDATVVEIKREAEERYSQQLQQNLQKTVWWGGCRSWYTKEGPDGKKWNAMTYPHSQGHYWYKCLFPVYRDWSYTMTPNVTRRQLLRRTLKILWIGLFVSFISVSLAAKNPPFDVRWPIYYVTRSWQALRQRLSL
ncbi:l-lysine 6-monooxygenase (NADPH-requiring) domain-containing protein [Hirsutella rhossiliensis]|uniref:L-lysine 6-monooxygenase (NADPH-requiring) domain-containing protein n=1 Tax=Hirsutella rhossiliensis TaxID=111463 RepID=A0A9P8SKL2_9HYPO|nr:l-lysine 6-monooxygenase (NADPH-requiring) domain-containing protein [Hirsutella rhossiliensis]KAH0964251.1 l-lysine 6-monooxygenase (NADPH-requiring) domain-containing protein [Hirsutella rhossiliensis]